jgi:hypothetical protein
MRHLGRQRRNGTTSRAASRGADSALVTAGGKYDLMNGWSFTAKFDGEFSSNTSIYSGTGMVRKIR